MIKQIETSKKILAASWIAAVTLTSITIIAVFMELDSNNVATLATLALAAWAELTAAHGFYYWKSKNENRAKYAQHFVKIFAKEYGTDATIQIAEIVLKD